MPPTLPREAPSQVRRPWRTTVRTVMVATVGLIPLLPDIARELDIATIPAVASVLAIIAAITRIVAIPEVDAWLDEWFPWLSADPLTPDEKDEYRGRHRAE